MKYILGISCFYHDSGAALLGDGEIIGAAQEERFTRKRHDESFPVEAIKYLISEANISIDDIETIVFYDKPMLKFERLLETYHNNAPKGLKSFLSAMKVWLGSKLFIKKVIKKEIKKLNKQTKTDIFFSEHHLSHAASAFYPSPFEDAAIVTLDGVGEWATTTICKGDGRKLTMLKEVHFPDSLGLLYSAFTYYCGFKVNSGEYKLMGLAPYGIEDSPQTLKFIEQIKSTLIKINSDGSFKLNQDFFNYQVGFTMCENNKWKELFGLPKRESESELTQEYMNLALAIQKVTEEVVIKIVIHAKEISGSENLVLAGGVALNCVANGKILQKNIFKNVWIQPAAGDAGGALGAAQAYHYISLENERVVSPFDQMQGSYLGPSFSMRQIKRDLSKLKANYTLIENDNELYSTVAQHIADDQVVGWFQGRMEFGPRALGNRSIIANPLSKETQKKLNLKIKYREGFRPFAPSVLEEDKDKFFELNGDSPYMLVVAPVKKELCTPYPSGFKEKSLYDRLYFVRSKIPSITHVDYSARVQTVSKLTNPKYWNLINHFKSITDCSLVVNTSFNVRGEPIVCTPEDAYRCFMRTEMDILVLENFILKKTDQPHFDDKSKWKEEFTLD